jgi:hypothetical protein
LAISQGATSSNESGGTVGGTTWRRLPDAIPPERGRTGDPNVAAPHDGRPFDRDGPPGEVYFLIVGCGLANLTLVAQGEFPAGPAIGRLETEGRFPRLQQFPVA